MKPCDRCGAALSDGDRYCNNCGRRQNFRPRPTLRRVWWRVLLIGLVLYAVVSHLLFTSGNPNLVPTVFLIGAFLVPVSYVVFLYESGALYDVPVATMALTFFYGGVLGVVLAQVLEQNLVFGGGLFALLIVAICEEVAKPIGVLWLIRRQELTDELHGLVLGGAAGMGFAALETMGYAFTFLIVSRGNLAVLGAVLITRGLLAPLGHGTWTAIVVGSIWRERTRGHFWLNRAALKGFGTAVILHALWDWTASAIPIDISLPGLLLHWRFVDLMVPGVDLPIPGLILGAVGLFVLNRMFRESIQRPVALRAPAA
ncbi:MAG TPA: PrsW family intramembrane metalloprotease [Chloroflexota bacterium]|nr:PrsW family intramembrane metalloprotease [Chloroflexota bacterium]